MMGNVWKYARKVLSARLSFLQPRHSTQRRLTLTSGLQFEGLEQRRLLSANQIQYDSTTSTVLIYGSEFKDSAQISVNAVGQVQVRLQTADGLFDKFFDDGMVASIKFFGGDSDDTFQNFTHKAAQAEGNGGNDVFNGGFGFDLFIGGPGDDRLNGGEGDDDLRGEDGNDLLLGWIGSDILVGGAGNDELWGNVGNDQLKGNDGEDKLYGEDGNDGLWGGAGDDQLVGSAGSDYIVGNDGNDSLSGDDGDDRLYGSAGNDWLSGWTGSDELYGGAGDDRAYGSTGDDRLYGDDGQDELYGEDGDDWLSGANGVDLMKGGAGNDSLYGGDGDDNLHGEDGDDQLLGEQGNDWLSGWVGNDTLIGGPDDDFLTGAVGDDHLNGEGGDDQLYGDEGNDWLSGWNGNDLLRGGVGDDYLAGGYGDDSLSGEDGNDELHGDDGDDWLSGWNGDDILIGGLGDDYLNGNTGNDRLHGEDGDDELYGETGDDWISGWTGNDLIIGAAGDDFLVGGDGDDHIGGEDGNDQLFGNAGNDWLSGWTGNDSIAGGSGDDFLSSGVGDDSLNGEDGNDKLYGEDGNDWLWGGAGNDELEGALGDDFLLAEDGDDSLDGFQGHDLLDGGPGIDKVVGGDGNDALIGGLGKDEVVGNDGEDLMLGGTTVYGQNLAALQALMLAWSAPLPYETRIAQIQGEVFAAMMQSEETVFDDGIADVLFGGEDRDWYFITGNLPVYRPEGVMLDAPEHEGHEHEDHHAAPIVVHELPKLEGFDLIDSLDTLVLRESDEAIHSKIPHADTPALQREHLSLFGLVRYDQVTHIAVRGGAWSDPATWQNGILPTDGSHVLIPYGVTISVDALIPTRTATVRVDGKLSFDATRNTELKVDTVVVSGSGEFEMGTPEQPISGGVTAKVTFTDNGPINRAWDPFGISRGLISHGNISVYGTEVTSYVTSAGPLLTGTQLLTLKSAPTGWKAGDTLVIASTNGSDQNEVRTIVAVAGNTVLLSQPLTYSHVAPAGLDVHVANVARNAIFTSESTANDRRGHVMFMHDRDVHVTNAGFYALGRTDKSKPLNDSAVTADWTLKPGTGTNQRARYPVHFHRNGLTNDGNPSFVTGSAVVDSPGWGFVNHSSFVAMVDNVAFDVHGAGFATEVGDEIGGFYNNLAIGSQGTGEPVSSRELIQDFGHQGDGFWFQGAGTAVVGNIAAGNDGNAFAFYTRGLYEGGPQKEFVAANLTNPTIAKGAPTIAIGQVPMANFRDNVGYSSQIGLLVRYHLENSTHGQSSLFQDSTFWNNETGVALHYAQNTVLKNLTVIDGQGLRTRTGVAQNLFAGNNIYDHLTVSGYHTGIDMPRWGNNAVVGGNFSNNDYDIFISNAALRERSILLTGFVGQPKIRMWVDGSPIERVNIDFQLVKDDIVLNYGAIVDQHLFFVEQSPNFILFSVPRADVPASYLGLTNEQLWAQSHVALGGMVAPWNTFTVPFVLGGIVATQ